MYVCIYMGITPCRCVCADTYVCVCMCTIHVDVHLQSYTCVYIMCFLFFYDVETICDFIEGFSDVWEDGHVHAETHTHTNTYIYIYM